MPLLPLVLGALFFLALGSFSCVVIDRLPVALSEPNRFGDLYDTRPWGEVLGGRSRCSECGTDVRPVDNIPVVSFILLRGRCRGCGKPIARFHPLVELATPALWVWAALLIGWSWLLLPIAVLIPLGLVVSTIDLRTLIVPTRVVWPGAAVLAVACVVAAGLLGEWPRLLDCAVGVALLAGPLFLIWFAVPKGMGFGDVRLAVMLGVVVGFYAGTRPMGAVLLAIITLALASVLSLVLGLGALGLRGRKAQVPFGPGLVLAAFVCAIYAPDILTGWSLYSV